MRSLFVPLLFLLSGFAAAQEKEKINTVNEQQLESLAASRESVPEEDAAIQFRAHAQRHLLNLNTADADELNALQVLLPQQVDNLITYRRLLGKLLSIYELQAIPGWDLSTIHLILAYCTVTDNIQLIEKFKQRWKGGEKIFLVRYSEQPEKAKGYLISPDAGKQFYAGGRMALFSRYQYNFKQLLQWGITSEKDAGEPFLKGKQRGGFDFYSIHFYMAKLGIIKALALGDFTINLGQGLVQWQSMAFGKSADVLMVKRASPVIKPYSSSGEYNFQRGLGITIGKQNWELTFFASLHNISSNQVTDTVSKQLEVTSLKLDGLHRTPSENNDRNNLRLFTTGGRAGYTFQRARININFIQHRFSVPLQPPVQPYDLFSLQGNKLSNISMDYSYSFRNIHWFGEFALDDHFNKALISGALVPVAPVADLSFLYRNISPRYRSINASAFTVNTNPVNESGLFMGVSLRFTSAVRLDGSADLFHFPWLKYLVDAPSYGSSYLIQLTYTPRKSLEIIARYKYEYREEANKDSQLVIKATAPVQTRGFRFQVNWEIARTWALRERVELSGYSNSSSEPELGFLFYTEGWYKPVHQNWSANLRLQYAETGGTNARIYGYENDVLYSTSIPFSSGKEFRYYCNLQLKTHYKSVHIKNKKNHVNYWFKFSQSIFPGSSTIGTGLDQIKGNHKTDIRLQAELIL
jgi:DNA uptake protein ComE-like DNA-binding protein